MANFSPREIEIMAHAWKCINEEPKVDYAKLAALCKMTNTGSASNAWCSIKKKLLAHSGEGKSQSPPAKSSPKKRGVSLTKDEDEDDEEPSPSKKKMKGCKKKTRPRLLSPFDDDEDDTIMVKREDGEE